MRHFLLIAVWGTLLTWTGQLSAALSDEIISEALAERYGLTRMWVTQCQVNRAQDRLQAVVYYDGTLYTQSNRATLEAIDAETGRKLWSKLVGQPSHPSLPPSVFRDLLATINGSTLIVLNRYTGDIVYQTVVNGAPGGGAALSSKRAYVPMVNGMILAYRLEPITDAAKEFAKINPHAAQMSDDEKKEAAKKAEEERRENIRLRQDYIPPLACNSTGRALVAPLLTTQTPDEEFVSWGTDRGYLYVGRIDRRSEDMFIAKYRLGTKGIFNNTPAYMPPDPKVLGDSGVIYAGSTDGYVYALLERQGELLWKFPTSEPVIDSPVWIEDRLYVTTELGGLFCINAKSGKQNWWTPEILHFVAAGKQRIYAADKLGRLRILDARNGAVLDVIPTSTMPMKVSNGVNDRIYLATEGGIVQCLREIDQVNPIVYNESRKPVPDDERPKTMGKPRVKTGDGAPKVAHTAPKKAKKDDADAGADDADPMADKPAKKAVGAKAAAAKTAPAKGNKAPPAKDGDNNPFGGN